MSKVMQMLSGLRSWLLGLRLSPQQGMHTIGDTKTEDPQILIHKILAGPYQLSDDPMFNGGPEDDFYFLEVMIETGGIVEECTLMHKDFDKIYPIVAHFSTPTIEPYDLLSEEVSEK